MSIRAIEKAIDLLNNYHISAAKALLMDVLDVEHKAGLVLKHCGCCKKEMFWARAKDPEAVECLDCRQSESGKRGAERQAERSVNCHGDE